MAGENLELFWRTVEAFNSGDVEGAVRACRADVEFLPQRAAVQGVLRWCSTFAMAGWCGSRTTGTRARRSRSWGLVTNADG